MDGPARQPQYLALKLGKDAQVVRKRIFPKQVLRKRHDVHIGSGRRAIEPEAKINAVTAVGPSRVNTGALRFASRSSAASMDGSARTAMGLLPPYNAPSNRRNRLTLGHLFMN